MSGNKHALPLVFALAMAVDAGNVGAKTLNANTAFEPGSLAGLLEAFQRDLPAGSRESQPGDGNQVHQAQWGNFPNFPNFFNCFTGNWRNC
jgi:hypothetical protein